MLKVSEDSQDTLRRLQRIREEPNRPGETYVEKFKRIMSEPSKPKLRLIK